MHEFLLYYGLGLALVAWLLFRPRRKKQVHLQGLKGAFGHKSAHPPVKAASAVVPLRPNQSQERQLNVIFNYNGHSFDAFEVLGLPAGSSLASAESAYALQIKSADRGARAFLDAAIGALREQASARP
jgi:hypothetical protein